MTTARDRNGRGACGLRALTAVVALYALVLQAVLGGAAALPFPAVAAPSGPGAAALIPGLPLDVHCLTLGAAADDESAPHGPARHHPGCCTLAPAAAVPPPPLAASTPLRHRPAVRLVWRVDAVFSARAPPGTVASARAPPVA